MSDTEFTKSFNARVWAEAFMPVAVVLGYEMYLIIQDQMKAMMETFDTFSDPEELKSSS